MDVWQILGHIHFKAPFSDLRTLTPSFTEHLYFWTVEKIKGLESRRHGVKLVPLSTRQTCELINLLLTQFPQLQNGDNISL